MSSVEVVTEVGLYAPLLQNSSHELAHEEAAARGGEITSSVDEPGESTPDSAGQKRRLVSIDIFRGLTVALMILVDDAGKSFPAINHSPWFGVTLADFVMPFFLFIVGTSVSLVFKKVPNKTAATRKVVMRSIKLFLLGLILQGGYFHGRHHLTYGVDLDKIRFMGVLQRISVGYFLASILEIWLVNDIVVESAITFLRRYCFQLVVAVLLSSVYLVSLYIIYVPNWTFEVSSLSIPSQVSGYGSGTETVSDTQINMILAGKKIV